MEDRRVRAVLLASVLAVSAMACQGPSSATAQWVVLAGPNSHGSKNVPDELDRKLNELAKQGLKIKSVAFAPNGGWVVLADKSAYFARGIPDEAFAKLGELAKAGLELKSVAFTPNGGWIVFADKNTHFARGIPDEAFAKVGELAKAGLEVRSVAFTPNGGWVVLADKNTYLARGIPDEAFAKLGEFAKLGLTLKSISFAGEGWLIVADGNVYFARGIPDEAFAKLGEFAKKGLELRAMSVMPSPLIKLSADDAETRKKILERMAAHKVPGLSIAVIRGGKVAWARGYGVARAESSAPVTVHTRFQAASISKPVAALGALKLVEKGMLLLDESLNAKLTSWKIPDNDFTRAKPPTLRQALSHSAGFSVHGFAGYPAGARLPTLGQVLDGKTPANSGPIRIEFLPGSKSQYSGGGYTVVQRLMMDVSREPFPRLMRSLVLDPLEMKDSSYEQPMPKDMANQLATAHVAGKPIPGFWHVYPEMAAAGLWTTPSDLAQFVMALQKAHQGGKSPILGERLISQMMTRQQGDFGLGVLLSGDGKGSWFSHNGVNAGFECGFIGSVDGGEGAVVMTNAAGGSALVNEVFQMLRAEYGWSNP